MMHFNNALGDNMDDMHKHKDLCTQHTRPRELWGGVRAIILAPRLASSFISIAGAELGCSLARQPRQQQQQQQQMHIPVYTQQHVHVHMKSSHSGPWPQ